MVSVLVVCRSLNPEHDLTKYFQTPVSISEDDPLFEADLFEDGNATALVKVNCLPTSSSVVFSIILALICLVWPLISIESSAPCCGWSCAFGAWVSGVPCRLESEDTSAVHLVSSLLMGRATKGAGGGSGLDSALQGGICLPSSEHTGTGLLNLLPKSKQQIRNWIRDHPSVPPKP